MRGDFYLRFFTVLFFMLGSAMVLVLFAISPSILVLLGREKVVNETLENQKNEPLPEVDQKVLSTAEEINSKLDIVASAKENKFIVSERVINELVLNKMADIKITGISYEASAQGERKVRINGSAPSRERLVLFRRALEDSLAFKQIDLPISNFVKGSNIEFSLTLVPS